ncbi:homeodomain protein [Escherichia coli]|nr:homeodomain protein [Escherichia coli N1]KHH05079.1 homeodomain protein [Escherichia coli]GDG99440.1 hypothetical protein BvCmsKKP036_03001 [Escherichia coli]SQZ72849.1 radical SAM domain-containing protein [Escherichia coli]VUX17622.1 Uncharacterised protein [Escherichia fergusonii]
MGLFDEVVGAFLKGDAGKYQAILSWVEEQGGFRCCWKNCKVAA